MNAPRRIVGLVIAAALSLPALALATSANLGGGDGGGQRSGNGSSTAHSLVNTATGSGGGDTTILPSRGASDAPASSTSDTDNDPAGSLPVSGGARQAAPRPSSPGWQSLLPGSIQ